MFDKFKYENIPLEKIDLDTRNPRIVTQKKLANQEEILRYLIEHEDLERFMRRISLQGLNQGAERPYLVKTGHRYTVVEGNTRIATYKLLTGLVKVPSGLSVSIPSISMKQKKRMLNLDCTIAPDRDSLLPIMASAHFGTGDKSKWGYLGSRKAVYDEYSQGRSTKDLAKVFHLSESEVRDLLLEYKLYLEALKIKWMPQEEQLLTDPAVAFNPPVRFLQTGGHKEKVGIELDKASLSVKFSGPEAKKKFAHLVRKLVLTKAKGLGATSTYQDVYGDYSAKAVKAKTSETKESDGELGIHKSKDVDVDTKTPKLKEFNGLFPYQTKKPSLLLRQLMIESNSINIGKFPASATLLLRMVLEMVLKELIDEANANPIKKPLDLEASINLCLGQGLHLKPEERKILKEFKSQHLDHLNLAAHANVKPNTQRLTMARDCVDQFIKSYV